jgi:hypothetical protein
MMFCTVLPRAARKGHDGVGDAADDPVGPPAEIAGGDARQPAHQKDQHDRGDRDEKIQTGSNNDTAEDVAAKLIGAEPVLRRWRLERGRGVTRQRIVGHEHGSEDRRDQDQHQKGEGERGHRIFGENVSDVLQGRSEASRRTNRRCVCHGGRCAHPSSLTRGSMMP